MSVLQFGIGAALLALYLIIGYVYSQISNRIFFDNRSEEELTDWQKLLRTLFFPSTSSRWDKRTKDSGFNCQLRLMCGHEVKSEEDWAKRYTVVMLAVWPIQLAGMIIFYTAGFIMLAVAGTVYLAKKTLESKVVQRVTQPLDKLVTKVT